MASFRNSRFIPLVAGLGMIGAIAAGDEPAKPAAPDATPSAPATKPAAKDRLDLPVPKGQPQKGLRIPIYSPEGKLMMSFQIGVAEVIDADNIKMGDLHLETFKENGEHEFNIDLPNSIFNAKTKEVTSKAHVTVKRHDFEISGNSMTFNTETKVGKFGDGVKMIIYDARAAVAEDEKKPAVPDIEVKPVQEEKK
ncbi:MAG: hypothetical protein ABI318_03905 [Chthoniobacteraceae bacterium]